MALTESKLALGTAQFGMDYGISNRTGRISDGEMAAILARCREAGLDVLDTAAVYGDAEDRLGPMLAKDWMPKIVTKTVPLADAIDVVERQAVASLERLGRDHVYGLLVHHTQDLLGDGGPDLWRLLERLRDEGRAEKIGVSIYTAEQADSLLRRYPLEIVQLPASLLDQRLVRNGTADRLKSSGVEIHVRSIFLQGLLFLASDELPPGLAFARAALEKVQVQLDESGATPLRAALAYVLSRPEFDFVVVGVSSLRELDGILEAARSPQPDLDWDRCALADERILNPSLWAAH